MNIESAFEILGLPIDATEVEVIASFRRLASEKHPDKGGSSEEFIQLRQAYELALVEARKPLMCPSCLGVGTKLIASGFHSMKQTCNSCGGSGKIDR